MKRWVIFVWSFSSRSAVTLAKLTMVRPVPSLKTKVNIMLVEISCVGTIAGEQENIKGRSRGIDRIAKNKQLAAYPM